jgi:hypothetical protein
VTWIIEKPFWFQSQWYVAMICFLSVKLYSELLGRWSCINPHQFRSLEKHTVVRRGLRLAVGSTSTFLCGKRLYSICSHKPWTQACAWKWSSIWQLWASWMSHRF